MQVRIGTYDNDCCAGGSIEGAYEYEQINPDDSSTKPKLQPNAYGLMHSGWRDFTKRSVCNFFTVTLLNAHLEDLAASESEDSMESS